MTDFLNMGGYAVFVWSAYGISALGLTLLAVVSFRGVKRTQDQVESLRPRRRREG